MRLAHSDAYSIAIICHEANRAYCQSLGDDSQVPWGEAPSDIKASSIDGVYHLYDNPNAGPSSSHDNWLALKRSQGWVYGSVKSPEEKTHPCFVPYDELPQEQKSKDYIFSGVCRALLASL
jgi:hypothetical protein